MNLATGETEKNMPLLSIIIPCRNEDKYIGDCLDSIISNLYPKDRLEVFVVDGMSEDRTQELVESYSGRYPFIKLLLNTQKNTPAAMNLGIKEASGDYRLILSSHSKLENDFLKNNVEYLSKDMADCVGGILITLPANNSLMAKSIALALSHRFGIGNAYFRIGTKTPRYVDTVPFGCYKKEVFEKIGLFDEELIRNQDDEFNFRLIKNGGKILLVPSIISHYYARDSLLKLWRMFYQYGYFKPLVAKKVGSILTLRQLIPAVFISSLFVSGLLSPFSHYFIWLFFSITAFYLLTNLSFSFYLAKKKGTKYIFVLPFVFSTIHFSYGLGYVKGSFDFIILRRRQKLKYIPISR